MSSLCFGRFLFKTTTTFMLPSTLFSLHPCTRLSSLELLSSNYCACILQHPLSVSPNNSARIAKYFLQEISFSFSPRCCRYLPVTTLPVIQYSLIFRLNQAHVLRGLEVFSANYSAAFFHIVFCYLPTTLRTF
ncbi:hypothetical protein T4D_3231 [Trichinella pseudospiralis]|nr:hypothetical protein T4D_4472 [Trichinella pseudospiralis]KRY80141.1 hypothetical protein T4D_3231 [Trichinella pseudospiralis]